MHRLCAIGNATVAALANRQGTLKRRMIAGLAAQRSACPPGVLAGGPVPIYGPSTLYSP